MSVLLRGARCVEDDKRDLFFTVVANDLRPCFNVDNEMMRRAVSTALRHLRDISYEETI